MTDKSYQPTIAGLRAFVAIAEKQHFGSAATTLGVSQSTLSQALSALETGLGVQLVERSTRRVFLTGEGRALLPQAQAVIEAATAFTAAAAGSEAATEKPRRTSAKKPGKAKSAAAGKAKKPGAKGKNAPARSEKKGAKKR